MRLINYLQTKLPVLAIFGLALGMTSCGSYQYVGQNSDGIYGEENRQVEAVPEKTQEANNNNYYKNYFKEKSLEMEASDENEVFVDIDSYQGNYSDEANQEEGYGAWGENGTEVTVNVYDNGWGFYNNWNRPFWGWNRWGWNRNFVGWNGGFWNGGFGWNSGFYNSFWCPPYYGYAFNGLPQYYGYYGRYNSFRNDLAYNNTRRGGLSRTTLNRRNTAYRNNNSTRIRTTRSNTRNNTSGLNSTRRVRANSSSNNTTRPQIKRTRNNSSSAPTRPSKPRVKSTPRTNRSYSPSRNASPSRNRSASPSRSSSSSRSSGSRRKG